MLDGAPMLCIRSFSWLTLKNTVMHKIRIISIPVFCILSGYTTSIKWIDLFAIFEYL